MNPILEIVLKVILLAINFIVFIATGQFIPMIKTMMNSGKLRSVPVDGDESHRQTPEAAANGLAQHPAKGVHTIYEWSNRAFSLYENKQCMGTREYIRQQSVRVKEFGDIKWRSYAEVGQMANKFGAALRSVGLVAAPAVASLDQLKTPCSLAIFENTCAEWMIAAQGCFTQSIIVTTIYSTLGMDSVIIAVDDCNISAIVCNRINVKDLVGALTKMPTLKTIIYTNDLVGKEDKIDLPIAPAGIRIISFDDFVAMGDVKQYPATPPTPKSCAVVMFTSGSTGKPKGVVVSHANMISTIAGAIPILAGSGDLAKDVYLGYLPLAHILELMAELSLLGCGGTIGYADPKTLTTAGSVPIGALEAFSPTMMAGVPKIWDVIKKGAEAKIKAASPVVQFLFKVAFEARSWAMARGCDSPFFAALVFKKFKGMVGGRLRLAVSGGGPLSPDVQIFIRTCFGCPLVQGYGLTETCAGLTIQHNDDLRTGVAGTPLSCGTVKLQSELDIKDKNGAPYLSNDRVDADGHPIFGRGEVLLKGNNVSLGYYMMHEKTKEEYDSNGYFHTGDIGQFMDDGSIKIVDRKKNLVKLHGGEYIAIEAMESAYGNSKFVDAVAGGIVCYGDGTMDRPIALLQINKINTLAWAKESNIDMEWDSLLKSKELYEAAKADLLKEAAHAGLSNIEKIAGLCFLTEPWTPQNGCLTAANKIDRRNLLNMFKTEFEATKKKGVF